MIQEILQSSILLMEETVGIQLQIVLILIINTIAG